MAYTIKIYSIEDFKVGDKLLRVSFYSWQTGKTAVDEWTITELKPKSVYIMTPRYSKADRVNISKIGEVSYGHVWCKEEDAEEFFNAYWTHEQKEAENRLASAKEELQKAKDKLAEGFIPENRY